VSINTAVFYPITFKKPEHFEGGKPSESSDGFQNQSDFNG